MKPKTALAVVLAVFAVPFTDARVLPAAPLTDRLAVPAVQERTNRYFVMLEHSFDEPHPILTPPGFGGAGTQLVRYDSSGEHEPEVMLPRSSSRVDIGATAVFEDSGGFPRILTYTDASVNADNPSRQHRFLYSANGIFYQPVISGAPPQTPVRPDHGGPLARENAEGAWIRPGTSDYPFVLLVDRQNESTGLELMAIAADGQPRSLGNFGASSGAVPRFIGADREGSRLLIAGTVLLPEGQLAEGVRIVSLDGQMENVLPLPSGDPGLEGWITPDGTVYLLMGRLGEPRTLLTYKDGQRIDSIPLGVLGFATPVHDFSGAWIIQRAAGQRTDLLRHTPGIPAVELWTDPSAPRVEAIHSAESGERLLIQAHRARAQRDGSQVLHPVIAVWETGDPAPPIYHEMFLDEGPLKGFVNLDVDEVARGGSFFFDSAMSRSGPLGPPPFAAPPEEAASDISQNWGVVRSSLRQRLVITSVARTPGAHGSMWRSDVVLHNQSTRPVAIELEFVPGGSEGQPRRFVDLTLASRETRLLPDVVLTVFGLEDANGALYLEPQFGTTIAATSRTYSASSNGGTFGMGKPAIDIHEAPGPRFAQTFAGAIQGANFRTNVVVADVSGRGSVGWLRAQPSGESTGRFFLHTRVPAGGQRQHNDISGSVQLSDSEIAALVFRPLSGEAIATVVAIDNRTNDPGYFPPDLPAGDGVIPAIAHAAGANGAQFRSDLFLFNPNLFFASVTLAAKRWDTAEAESLATITLNPGEVRVLPDVFLSLFGKTGVGRLRYFSSGNRGVSVRVTSRLYTVEPSGATFGVVMPPVSSFQSAGEMEALEILGARGGSQFRTNLALVELRDLVVPLLPAEGRVEIFGPSGDLIDEFEFIVPRAGAAHYLDIFRSRGLGDGPEVALIRVSVSRGRIAAFASSLDKVTNDSTHLSATQVSGTTP